MKDAESKMNKTVAALEKDLASIRAGRANPAILDKVTVEYHFYGPTLEEAKLQRAVDLSIEKYCGVMEMFRQFAKVEIEIFYHN